MFALESLSLAGESHSNSSGVRRACEFLISKQMDDGGWGETYMVSWVSISVIDPISSFHTVAVVRLWTIQSARAESSRSDCLDCLVFDLRAISR